MMDRRRFYLLFFLAALLLVVSGGVLRRFLSGIPSYHKIEEHQPSQTTMVYDMRGEVVARLSIEKRALLSLSQIPVDLQNAVIATEDADFFNHWGISVTGIMRAFLRNLKAGRVVQGGSTLTQQLAKLIFLTPERKIIRKLREMVLAVQMERNLSKEEILQLYLNQVYFGHGAYGVKAAARIYFGKPVKELTLAECALLAGMVKYPGGYSPFNHPKRAANRRKLVLERMVDEEFITGEEMLNALKEPIPAERPAQSGIQAPYFVKYINRHLEPEVGYQTFWRGGLKIHSTLDLHAQLIAEQKMEKALTKLDKEAYEEWESKLEEDIKAGIEPPRVSTSPPARIQGVFMALDVKSGAIRVMIGGRGDDDFNRITQAKRQPGSTIKPFVWAEALKSGMTGVTLVADEPLAYYYDGRDWRLLEGTTDQYAIQLATAPFVEDEDFGIWIPNNYDNKFKGVITLRTALALSRNMVSVRLTQHIGPPRIVELCRKLGIRSYMAPVPALGLGTSVMTPYELASAYQAFANGGIHVEPYAVAGVEDTRGRVIRQHVPKEEEVLSPEIAYLITHLMQVVVQAGTGRRALALKRPVAGKTGTSNSNRDLWFVGFTPDLLAVAWMGFDDDTSMGRHHSSGRTVQWWTDIMGEILKDYPPRAFTKPEDIIFLQVDPETGLLALPTCPRKVLQAFIRGTEPHEYCPYDHSQPIELKPAFTMGGAAAQGMDESLFDEDGPGVFFDEDSMPSLPSEEELDELSQPERTGF